MVVECPECGTRFSLEENRISGATAQVRCSRCRAVFRINRAGQVVAPPRKPAAPPPEESLPAPGLGEEISAPPTAAGVEPSPVAEEVGVSEEAASEALAETTAATPAPPKKRRLWLWLVVLLLVAIILGELGWWAWHLQPPEPAAPDTQAGPSAPAPLVVTPSPPPVPAADLQDLPVDWARARYEGLVNARGEQLLVIRGEVANEGKAVRGPIRVKAILTDAQHQPMKEEVVYTGTTLTDEELRTLDPKEIRDWLNQPGGRSQELELKPGEKQAFTVVFSKVPANLAEIQAGFQLVVVEGPVVGGESAPK